MTVPSTRKLWEELLVSARDRPSHIKPVNLRVLSPLQRVLLVTDGTVTRIIEAYTLEPVEVRVLRQRTRALAEPNELLELDRGTLVVQREVSMQGRYSARVYGYADSLLVPGRLPQAVMDGLDAEGEAIGRLLERHRMETRREVLWLGRETLSEPGGAARGGGTTEFITRTYRIVAHHKPIVLIQEKFPVDLEGFPAHH